MGSQKVALMEYEKGLKSVSVKVCSLVVREVDSLADLKAFHSVDLKEKC
jgi:hypothetical protein